MHTPEPDTPLGRHTPQQHTPPQDTIPPPDQTHPHTQRYGQAAVGILLECILVLVVSTLNHRLVFGASSDGILLWGQKYVTIGFK